MNPDYRYDWLDTPEQWRTCFELMRVLRPQLNDADDFARRVQRQAEQGYRLLAARIGDEVVGLAGGACRRTCCMDVSSTSMIW